MWTDENGDPNPEESAANARLIAASPDLLKAAKNVVTAATENSRATYEVAGGPFEDLIDAIAKAESDDV